MPMANADHINPVFATSFLLLAQYGGRAVIPLEFVRRDYFPHLTIDSLLRKTTSGELALPIVRIEDSLKAAKGVHAARRRKFVGMPPPWSAPRSPAPTDGMPPSQEEGI
jgi:Pyocin activator protein PrtN